MYTSDRYANFAKAASRFWGRPRVFMAAVAVIVLWLAAGPLFHFSDAWQLIINTATNILTLLMVFLLQNSQNRDTEAMQIKLDELIRVTKGAHLALLDLEELNEEDLEGFRESYEDLAAKARAKLREGQKDTGSPEPVRPPSRRPSDSDPE